MKTFLKYSHIKTLNNSRKIYDLPVYLIVDVILSDKLSSAFYSYLSEFFPLRT